VPPEVVAALVEGRGQATAEPDPCGGSFAGRSGPIGLLGLFRRGHSGAGWWWWSRRLSSRIGADCVLAVMAGVGRRLPTAGGAVRDGDLQAPPAIQPKRKPFRGL